MLKKSFFAIIIIFLSVVTSSNAQIPQLVNYQAILTDAQGNPINGVRSVQFSIYDKETGGDALWSETQNVIVTDGLCNVLLGAVTLIPYSVFNGGDKYFSLKIGNDPEMTPRKRLVSVGYAFHASKSDSLNGFAAPDFVRSLDGVTPDEGNIDLVAGSNVTIKPDDKNNSITISASGGSTGDDLGNHTATQNIQLNGHYLSGDGGDEGVYITNNGNVGIGTANPLSMLSIGGNGSSRSVIFSQATGDIYHGGRFRTDHSGGYGVSGEASGSYGRGVYGYTTSSTGRGVYGEALNSGNVTNYGGYFTANGDSGRGVYGYATGLDGQGVSGKASGSFAYGVYGEASGSSGYGVYGYADGSHGRGVSGWASNDGDVENYGGFFVASGSTGRGVYGVANGSDGCGVHGKGTKYGGKFSADGSSCYGVHSWVPSGNYAGYFQGKVHVTETISKGGGSFKIDHPLDPENKYLYHSFVESPDMMNIYNGNVVTDANGHATVDLPEWFEALNKDFRYQLTVIGEFAQAIVSDEISNNQFSVKTDKPNIKVSWQVTGVRQDAFANANRIPVEEMKEDKERGKYLHPEAFNMPKTAGLDYEERME